MFVQVWGFEPGQEPEAIDWLGQRAQVDLALKHGLQQVVLVSSMGVTQADHPLNRMGKILVRMRWGTEDAQCGSVVLQRAPKRSVPALRPPRAVQLWKRFAEMYLIAHSTSATAYTIVHPGGLIDQPGGQRQVGGRAHVRGQLAGSTLSGTA